MFLSYPLALLGLLALPVLVGIYILRNRYRRHPVSSLLLWELQVKSKEGGAQVTRLQTPLTLLLELLALTLLVLAAVDPRWKSSTGKRPLIVILDNSASMLARTSDGTVKHLAEQALMKEVDNPLYGNIRVLFADAEAHAAGPPVRTRAALKEQLTGWNCQAPHSALNEAVAMASEIGDALARVWVITDKPFPAGLAVPEGGRMRWQAVGSPLGNRGIVNASRSSGGKADRCLLEVANLSPHAAETTLRISGQPDRPLSLAAMETRRIIFEVPRDADTVVCRLDDDALSSDNEVRLVREPTRQVKLQLDFRTEALRGLVQNALAARGEYVEGQINPHLLLTDRPARNSPSPDTWTMAILPDAEPRAFAGPYVVNTEHPLTEGLSLEGTVWGAAVSNRTVGLPVISAGNLSLVIVQEGAFDKRDVVMHFNPDQATLHRNPNWPILICNMLDWRASALPGVAEANRRVGTECEIRTGREDKEVIVKTPDGTERTVPVSGRRCRIQLVDPGVYALDVGGRPMEVAANMLSAEESDLRGHLSQTWGEWNEAETVRREYRSSAWIFLLLAGLVLLSHLWLMTRHARL